MTVDGESRELGPNETVHIPAGVLHEGGTLGDERVHRVVVFAPGGMERFFEALARTERAEDQLRLAQRHGWDFST